MRSAHLGRPTSCVWSSAPVPAAAGEVLIEVAAAGVNRPDVLQRRGGYPPPPGASDLPGLEVAGRVAALGPPADGVPVRWREGDAVCALVAGGGYAEYCAAPAVQCLPVPAGCSMVEAAAHSRDVLHGLDQRVRARPAAGGRVAAGPRRLERHRHDGDPAGAGVRRPRVRHRRIGGQSARPACGSAPSSRSTTASRTGARCCGDATGGRGVDVILDMVGGDYVARNLALLAVDGRLVQIAFLSVVEGRARSDAGDAPPADAHRLDPAAADRRPRRAPSPRALEAQVWPLLAAGTVRPVIHATFPLARAADAHRMMEASEHIGKIVLEVRSSEGPVRPDQLGLDVRAGHRLLAGRRPGRLGLRVGHHRLRLHGDDHRRGRRGAGRAVPEEHRGRR